MDQVREFVWHHRKKASEYITLYLGSDYLKQIAIEYKLSEETQLTHRVIFLISRLIKLLSISSNCGNMAANQMLRDFKSLREESFLALD